MLQGKRKHALQTMQLFLMSLHILMNPGSKFHFCAVFAVSVLNIFSFLAA